MTGETRMCFSCCRNEQTGDADCTSSGRVFQKMAGWLLIDGTVGRAAAA